MPSTSTSTTARSRTNGASWLASSDGSQARNPNDGSGLSLAGPLRAYSKRAGDPSGPEKSKHGDERKTGLLRAAGRLPQSHREGNSHGFSKTRPQISPRSQSRRQGGRRKIQAASGSLRHLV